VSGVDAAKTDSYRNPDGTFAPGNPGGGRPKGSVSLKRELLKQLSEAGEDGKTIAERLVEKTIADALAGDSQSRKLAWEYIEGKPNQPTDVNLNIVPIVDDI
jgi:hypothetical protein